MTAYDSIAALVLAAGYSSRMNGFKPLLKLGAVTVLERVIELFRGAGINDVRVVVGYRATELILLLEQWGVRWVLNEKYPEGMISSIKAGVATIERNKDAFFVLPVDVPLVRRHTLPDLIQAYHGSGKAIIYPTFRGRRGHPPLISAGYADEILRWEGSGGLRDFLKQKEHEAGYVEVADEHIVLDMDTSADYEAILKKLEDYSVPSVSECLALLSEKFSVRGHLLAHSKTVAKVAFRLGRGLNEKGSGLNLQLIVAAGLLHDIAKGQPNHASIAARALRELDYPAVADVVEAHMGPLRREGGAVTERDVVCLSDKLVQGDRIVSLETRFRKQLERHSDDPAVREAIETRLADAQMLARRLEETLGTPVDSLLLKSSLETPDAAAGNILTEAR